MRPALEVENLGVLSSDDTEIVAHVSFDIEPGELVGLLGETGAGKTLTARAILGMLPLGLRATGRVNFSGNGSIPLSQPARIEQNLGRTAALMLQNPMASFDPLQRIGSQLVEAVVRNKMLTKDAARERAGDLCRQLGLGDSDSLFRLYPHELSGGMSQRVALALTLMPDPQLLIVDEPTSALDANLRLEALELLRKFAAKAGVAMLLVSHDLGLVSNYCDKIAVLYAGHLVEMGSTSSVLESPSHPYTATLISCALRLSQPRRVPVPVIGGEPPLLGSWPAGCHFHPRCPDARNQCRTERPVLALSHGRDVACHFPR